MSLHAQEIDAAWDKLEMKITQTGDRHAKFYHEGKLIITTKRSSGKGPIEGPVQHLLRQQLKLNEGQFRDLIACPLDRAKYLGILRAKNLLPATSEKKS